MRCAVVVLVLCAAGCAAQGPRVVGRGAGVSAEALEAWEAAGKIGVTANERGGSGSFLWQQAGERSRIRMRGPVGVGGLEVELEDEGLSVATSDGRVLQNAAARYELAARLGADVPTQSLRYWMLGLPAPGPHEWRMNEEDERVLLQHGWRIEFEEFAAAGSTRLPSRLTASAGDTRVRLVITRWNLTEP